MNYVKQIKTFWTLHESHSFTTTEIALYFHLLEVCNICMWKNPFRRNNAKINADLGVSYNTLKAARNRLQQAGLLEFKSQNGSANTTYTLSNFEKVTIEVGSEVANEVTIEVGTGLMTTKDKLNKTKTKQEKVCGAPAKNPTTVLPEKKIGESPQVPAGPPYRKETVEEKEAGIFGQISIEAMCMGTHSTINEFEPFARNWWGLKKAAGDTDWPVQKLKSFLMADFLKTKKEGGPQKGNTIQSKLATLRDELGVNTSTNDGIKY